MPRSGRGIPRTTLPLRDSSSTLQIARTIMQVHVNSDPSRHWSTTVGDPRLNNFKIRLLVDCDGLEKDAARFRSRNTGRPAGDPSCVVLTLRTQSISSHPARHSQCGAIAYSTMPRLSSRPHLRPQPPALTCRLSPTSFSACAGLMTQKFSHFASSFSTV